MVSHSFKKQEANEEWQKAIHEFFERTAVRGVKEARREGAVRTTVLSAVPIVCLSMVVVCVCVGWWWCRKVSRKEEKKKKKRRKSRRGGAKK